MSTRRRILVTGGAGNVAGWLARTAPGDVELHVTEHRTPVPDVVRSVSKVHPVDLCRLAPTVRTFVEVRPDVVVHTAYAQSDRAAIVEAARHVVDATRRVGAGLVHLSTDVVFAGDAPPYAEDAVPDPITDYGRWKADAERVVQSALPDACITRTSLVVSLDPPDRSTAALLASLADGTGTDLFHDELRQPIRADDLAAELWALVDLDPAFRAGIWHLPGPEHLSRLELGRRLAVGAGVDPSTIRSTSAAAHPSPRPRDPELAVGRRSALGVRLQSVDT